MDSLRQFFVQAGLDKVPQPSVSIGQLTLQISSCADNAVEFCVELQRAIESLEWKV